MATIRIEADGLAPFFVGAENHGDALSVSNSDLREALATWCAAGNIIAVSTRRLTADDVRAECARRMRLLVGARNDAHLDIIISNGNREAIRLLRIGAANWTTEQATRAAQLEAADAEIERLRACSNAMEPDPPSDYTDNAHW
jgi:hypothetical protein